MALQRARKPWETSAIQGFGAAQYRTRRRYPPSGLESPICKVPGGSMKLFCSALAVAALVIGGSIPAHSAATWTEGVNYFVIQSAQRPVIPPGKVEVTEVFSYACPACNVFVPTMHKLKQSLPANVVLDYLPAAFNSAEDWPMFQMAYCTAQTFGVEDKVHDAVYDAVWKGGDLSVMDGNNLKNHMPTIEDAAKFYNQK